MKKRLQLRLQDAEGSDYTEHRRMLEPLMEYYTTFLIERGIYRLPSGEARRGRC